MVQLAERADALFTIHDQNRAAISSQDQHCVLKPEQSSTSQYMKIRPFKSNQATKPEQDGAVGTVFDLPIRWTDASEEDCQRSDWEVFIDGRWILVSPMELGRHYPEQEVSDSLVEYFLAKQALKEKPCCQPE